VGGQEPERAVPSARAAAAKKKPPAAPAAEGFFAEEAGFATWS
jgi:hypothetical protein